MGRRVGKTYRAVAGSREEPVFANHYCTHRHFAQTTCFFGTLQGKTHPVFVDCSLSQKFPLRPPFSIGSFNDFQEIINFFLHFLEMALIKRKGSYVFEISFTVL
jgi:hypothetical protein